MENKLGRPGLSWEERHGLVDDILDTRHAVLVPLAWRLIELPNPSDPTKKLIRFVSECPEQYPDLDARLAELATHPSWAGTPDAFSFWADRKADLPPAAWKTLTEADGVWTRALTYAVFAERCGKAWKDSLFLDLRDQSQPLPDPAVNKLLAELDDDDFDIREQASARLVRYGERAEAGLRRALDGPLSVEARQRVAAALERIAKAKQPPDCVQALGYFGSHDAPEDGELLRVLSEGAPDAWLTQQAKDKLAQWRKSRGNTEK